MRNNQNMLTRYGLLVSLLLAGSAVSLSEAAAGERDLRVDTMLGPLVVMNGASITAWIGLTSQQVLKAANESGNVLTLATGLYSTIETPHSNLGSFTPGPSSFAPGTTGNDATNAGSDPAVGEDPTGSDPVGRRGGKTPSHGLVLSGPVPGVGPAFSQGLAGGEMAVGMDPMLDTKASNEGTLRSGSSSTSSTGGTSGSGGGGGRGR